MIHITLVHFALAFGAAFLSGLIDTIAGGGGLITVPALMLLGLSPQAALGTNKLQACFGSGTAALQFHRSGKFDKEHLIFGIFMTLIGASLGTVAVMLISADFLKAFIPWLLLAGLIYILLSPQKKLNQTRKAKLSRKHFYLIFGLALGFYDGFFGPGTGSLWAIAFILLMGMNMVSATIHTKMFNFTSNLASLLWFIIGGHVYYILGIVMGVGQMIGAVIGSHLVMTNGQKLIKPLFVTMVTAMIIALLV